MQAQRADQPNGLVRRWKPQHRQIGARRGIHARHRGQRMSNTNPITITSRHDSQIAATASHMRASASQPDVINGTCVVLRPVR
jgi:hypothetical protein